jgi:Escherichia/Staphylococcus phage prohead protease
MTIEREIRLLSGLEIEERKDNKPAMLRGYAAVFDTVTDIGGYWREKLARGAFADAISKASADVHALFNHDANVVLGRMKAGTLRLAEDEKGLAIEIDPPDTQDARDLIASIKRGDIDQMSFAFTMRGGVQSWDDGQDPPLRTIEKVGDLYDVSVVTRGAYPTTEVGVRSLAEFRDAQRRHHHFSAAALRIRRKMDLGLTIRRMAS